MGICVLVSLGTLGCAPSARRAPPPVDTWLDTLDQIARARCERAVRCADDRERLYRDDVCRPPELHHAFWSRVFGDGEAQLDEAAAAACLAGLSSDAPCAYSPRDARTPWERRAGGSTVPRACGELTHPGRQAGDSCWGDALSLQPAWIGRDCSDGECLADPGCGASCVAYGREGSDCSALACAAGFHCDDASHRCVHGCTTDRECVVWPRGALCVGGACVGADDLPRPGEPCAHSIDGFTACGPDAWCGDGVTCGSLVPIGAPCGAPATFCDGGAVCDPTTSTCTPDCRGVRCPSDAPYCSESGACTPDPTAIVCSSWDDLSDDPCPAGYGCRSNQFSSGPCAPFVPIGAACDATVICEAGATCSAGTCARRVVPWAACADDAICPSDFECIAAACVYRGLGTFVSIGWACDDTTQCEYGQCIDGTCAWPPAGSACADAFDCAAGCEGGTCLPSRIAHDGEPCDPLTGGRVCDGGLACVPERWEDTHFATWICRGSCAP